MAQSVMALRMWKVGCSNPSRDKPSKVVKTGGDSSNVKRSAVYGSVTGPRK